MPFDIPSVSATTPEVTADEIARGYPEEEKKEMELTIVNPTDETLTIQLGVKGAIDGTITLEENQKEISFDNVNYYLYQIILLFYYHQLQ